MLLALFTIVVAWWSWKELGRRVRTYMVATKTGLNELAQAGEARVAPKIKGRAVICGGSIAGLLAARVCAAHFEEVVVIEPEGWTTTPEGYAPTCTPDGEPVVGTTHPKRTRVYQYEALHGHLCYLSLALGKLFPDYEDALKESGIPYVHGMGSIAFNGIDMVPPDEFYPLTGLPKHPLASRDTFERFLRRLTRDACPGVQWVTGTVVGVTLSPNERARLDGVVVRLENGAEERVGGALVVDCTGSSSAGARWLERAGYGSTGVSLRDCRITYDPQIRYRCFTWTVPPHSRAHIRVLGAPKGRSNWVLYGYAPDASMDSRLFGLNPLEGNKMVGICGGWGNTADAYPRTLAELRAYLRDIRGLKPIAPWVVEAVELLVADAGFGEDDELPFSDFRMLPPTFVRYHLVADLPSNFVALGDAILRVNPLHGQGSSKGAMDALTLNALLLRTTGQAIMSPPPVPKPAVANSEVLPLDFGKAFFKAQATKLEDMWLGTKISDYGWDTTVPQKGETLATGSLIRSYFSMVLRAAWTDREINHILFLAGKMIGPGSDLMSPWIVCKVLWNAFTASGVPPSLNGVRQDVGG